jgi:methylenetetrahydrofolate--tRNA-(uracil-5-)-methyltransferase
MKPTISVYGAGLAGCEAAWQAAERGVHVRLYEMKPQKYTPAHHSEGFAELVCSNSLRSDCVTNAVGLLKEEMTRSGSLIMAAAHATRVPAGSALAVDRALFSQYITERIRNHP